ncbi:RIO1 family regulatory kinase/ATPase [Chloroflexota bacterium]
MSNAELNNYETEEFDDFYNPMNSDRQARRKRKPRANPHERKQRKAAAAELADLTVMEAGFETTYQPSRHETGWLLQSIKAFFDMALINDVLAQVQGGKEANVYRCAAHPDTGLTLVAAKVYRPRMFRNLRRDHVYRQGRDVLTPEGNAVGIHAERVHHAIRKKTSYGLEAAHTSWLMHEYRTLKTLHDAGGAVPQPLAASGNAILMGYVGDERLSAPTLHEIALEPDEVAPLFAEVLRNIELMLQHGMVHGDLSAYNILYWDGAITLIDFPQVVELATNTQAYDILARDITRVCQYFARQGLKRDAQAILDDLWRRYGGPTPEERWSNEARFLSEPESNWDDDEFED